MMNVTSMFYCTLELLASLLNRLPRYCFEIWCCYVLKSWEILMIASIFIHHRRWHGWDQKVQRLSLYKILFFFSEYIYHFITVIPIHV